MGIVDIVALVLIALGALAGWKKGVIKTFVQLIGLVSITIVAFQFKGYLGDLMIRHLPFFNFGGAVDQLYALNLLFYQGIAFIVIFVLLYCLLNILIDLSGIVDMLLKLTIVYTLPSKILGAIIGAVEAIVFVFVFGFALLQFNHTAEYVMESKMVKPIVERTPVVNVIFIRTIGAAEEIYAIIDNYEGAEEMVTTNLDIITALRKFDIIDVEIIRECIDNGKLRLENVVVA